jgi:DNA-binding transcriptional ArsR family regulator
MPELPRHLDDRLAKALSHPLRVRILLRLTDSGVASPTQLAQALGVPVSNVSYHVGVLEDLECLELVRTERRRGALEHFYRATVRSWLVHEQLAQLPAAFRRTRVGRTLWRIVEDAAAASREGGFDEPGTHVSRLLLAVDEQGRTELAALLAETREAALRIDAESATRQAARGPGAPPTTTTELALLSFRPAGSN